MKNLFTFYFLVFFTFTIKSQINYFDINPDSIYTDWETHIIKINSNWEGDTGEFYISKHPHDIGLSSSYQGCQVLCDVYDFPMALENGDFINNNSSIWRSIQSDFLILNDGTNGRWSGKHNHYLGIRVQVETDFYYGWIKLDIDESPTYLRVMEYAYQSLPDVPILAGQNGLASVEESNISEIKLFPNPSEGIVNITFPEITGKSKIVFLNTQGQEVKTIYQEGESQTHNLYDLQPGLYQVLFYYRKQYKIITLINN